MKTIQKKIVLMFSVVALLFSLADSVIGGEYLKILKEEKAEERALDWLRRHGKTPGTASEKDVEKFLLEDMQGNSARLFSSIEIASGGDPDQAALLWASVYLLGTSMEDKYLTLLGKDMGRSVARLANSIESASDDKKEIALMWKTAYAAGVLVQADGSDTALWLFKEKELLRLPGMRKDVIDRQREAIHEGRKMLKGVKNLSTDKVVRRKQEDDATSILIGGAIYGGFGVLLILAVSAIRGYMKKD